MVATLAKKASIIIFFKICITEGIKNKCHFLILVISCPFLKVIFFKAHALMAADKSVHRLSQCFILSCWSQKFHPLILLTSVQMRRFQALHGTSPSYTETFILKSSTSRNKITIKNCPRLLLQTIWLQPGYQSLPKVHRLPVIHPKKAQTTLKAMK